MAKHGALDLEDLEPVGGPSDSDEEAVDEYSHNKLLAAISSLDGKKRQYVERSEPAAQVSEFHLAPGTKKVGLGDLVGALKQQTGHRELKKQLNRIDDRRKVLNVPLHKAEQERIQRSLNYEKTRDQVSKWEPVIKSNREAEQLIFPLGKPDVHLINSDQFVQRFKPRTPLEMEVAALLSGSQTELPKERSLTPAEERALKAMSLAEAKARRAELQKYRALLSYKEAKARRQNKIKSKKYHRILRKERQKKELKSLEELQKSDPEAYMEKIQKIEKQRAEERMTLKHRGGSKYMQKLKIFGKYDDKARQSIQDMIQKNKDLTAKMAVEGESSEEDSVVENLDQDEEDVVDETQRNPWMSAVPVKMSVSSSKYSKPDLFMEKTAPDSDVEVMNSNEIEIHATLTEAAEVHHGNQVHNLGNVETSEESEDSSEGEQLKIIEADIDDIFKIAEQNDLKRKMEEAKSRNMMAKAAQKKKGRKKPNKSKQAKSKKTQSSSDSDSCSSSSDSDVEHTVEQDSEKGIVGSLTRRNKLEDFEGNWSGSDDEEANEPIRHYSPSKHTRNTIPGGAQSVSNAKDIQVDPKKYLTVEKSIKPTIAADLITNDDEEDPEEQHRLTIAQAFAQDDVVEEFSQEKRNIEERDKPKDVDLTLPGWGEWDGEGMKVSRRKRKRFIIKAPPGPPRKDKALSGVIISERKDTTVAKHQVSELPFPFKAVHQFESSIRAPIGKTWNPETSFKKLVAPRVRTHMGAIIKPLDKAQAFDKDKMKRTMEEKVDNEEEESKGHVKRFKQQSHKGQRKKNKSKKK